VFKNATVTYDNLQRKNRETVLIPDLMLDWEGIRQPAILRGTLVMRKETIEFNSRISSPLAFIDRKSTGFSTILSGDMLNAQISGQLADYKDVRFAGQLEASGPSLRRILTFFGGVVSSGPGFGGFALSGTADIKPNELFIDQARVLLDGNVATGTIGVILNKTPKLSGTLAFQDLNLTPYLNAVGGADPVDWHERTVETDWFDNLDTDLRLSANAMEAGPYILGSMAASVILNGRKLEVGLAQSTFYDGIASGTISATDLDRDKGQKVGIQLRLTDFNLGQAIKMAGSPSDFGGTATMNIDVEAEGRTLGQQFDNLAGSISLLAVNGGAPDLGLGAAADALAANAPLNGISRGGASFYERLEIGGTIKSGSLSFSNLLITASAYAANLKGSFGVKSGEVNLTGSMTDAQNPEQKGRVEIRGAVASPMIVLTPAAQ
jgi:AsmA protein